MENMGNKTFFIPKNCYFTFRYFDIDFKYPSIQSWVFIGNASDLNDKISTVDGFFYFQDAESYANHGCANSKGDKLEEGEMLIWKINEIDAESELLDFNGLIQALSSRVS